VGHLLFRFKAFNPVRGVSGLALEFGGWDLGSVVWWLVFFGGGVCLV